MPDFASSNLVELRLIEETDFGVTPAGNPNKLRMTGESLSFSITKSESAEIVSDRQTTDLIETGASAAGGINFELSYKEFDTLLRAALMSIWAPYGTQGVGTSFQATTTATSIVAGTAPTGTSSFTGANGPSLGQWFQFNCPGHALDKKFLRAHSTTPATSTTITLDPATPGVVDAVAKAATLSTNRLTNGVTKKSFTIERAHLDIGQFFQFRGMTVSKINLSMASGAIVTGSIEFMGKDGTRSNATALGGSPISSQTFDVMNAITGVGQVMEGGSPMTGTTIKKLDISIDNTLRGQDGIGIRGNANIGLGTLKVTGSMDVYLADGTLYDKFLNNVRTSLQFVVSDNAKNGYAFQIPGMKFGDAKVNAGSKDSDCMISIPFTGLKDPLSGKTIFIDKMGVA